MPFPVEEKFIVETEGKFGGRFPESFREKMKKENGGSIDSNEDSWELFPFLDKSDKKRISRTYTCFSSETQKEKEDQRFPQNAIAIGSNGWGDVLIFLLKKKS